MSDIVKFGENISIIQKRATFENVSVLEEYDKTIDVFRDYYQYEIIEGTDRKKMEKIPEAAFREAIANALIHRAWDVEARIRVRNRILANVFYRLGFVEIFGTGITRIKQLYETGLKKPDFEISENTIKIVLPVLEKDLNLTDDERLIYKNLSKTMLKPISEIVSHVPFGKSKTTDILKSMIKKGAVKVEGRGRGTKYILK